MAADRPLEPRLPGEPGDRGGRPRPLARLDSDEHDTAFELAALRRSIGPPAELATAPAQVGRARDRSLRPRRALRRAGRGPRGPARPDRRGAGRPRAGASPATRPRAPAAQALARLQRLRGDWDQVASLLSRHAEAITDPPRAELADLHRELGEVLAEHLGRSEEAARAFKAALELDARNSRRAARPQAPLPRDRPARRLPRGRRGRARRRPVA